MYLVQHLWSSSEQTRIDDIFREKKEKKGNQLVPVSELIKCIKKESIARQYLELVILIKIPPVSKSDRFCDMKIISSS